MNPGTDLLSVEVEDRVATLTITNQSQRNALSVQVRADLVRAVTALGADPECRVLVLQGAGGTFSAGGDISGMGTQTVESGLSRLADAHACVRALAACRKPMIAAVEGWAVGAGLSIALLCDTIVAAEDARFATAFGVR